MAVLPKRGRITLPSELEEPGEIPVPSGMQEALSAMVDQRFLRSTKQQELQWRALREWRVRDADTYQWSYNTAHPKLLEFERAFVKACANHGVPMYAHNVIRDKEWQGSLKSDGFSDLTDGCHMYGMGADIVHSKYHWQLTKEQWAVVGHIGKEVAMVRGLGKVIEWGGDWKKRWDPAHWQIRNWRQFKESYPWQR